MKIALLHNPKAGRAQMSGRVLEQLFRKGGHDVLYSSIKDKGWTSVFREQIDRVVIAGGDGTVSRVAPLLVPKGIPFCILPLGTANNIARCLLQTRPIAEVVSRIATAPFKKIDLGWVSSEQGSQPFVETMGIGVLVELMSSMSRGRRKRQASIPPPEQLKAAQKKLLSLCDDYPGLHCEISIDGEPSFGQFLLIEAMNMQSVGPGLALADKSDPTDGQLDLVCLPEAERKALRDYVQSVQSDEKALAPFRPRRCRQLEIKCSDFKLHIDGKVIKSPSPALSVTLQVQALTYLDVGDS